MFELSRDKLITTKGGILVFYMDIIFWLYEIAVNK